MWRLMRPLRHFAHQMKVTLKKRNTGNLLMAFSRHVFAATHPLLRACVCVCVCHWRNIVVQHRCFLVDLLQGDAQVQLPALIFFVMDVPNGLWAKDLIELKVRHSTYAGLSQLRPPRNTHFPLSTRCSCTKKIMTKPQ